LQLLYSGDCFDSDSGKFLIAEKLQPAAWKQAHGTKLREEKRVSLRFGRPTAEASEAAAIPVPSETGTPKSGQQQEEDNMDLSEKAKWNESGGLRESPAKKRAKAQPLPAGVTIRLTMQVEATACFTVLLNPFSMSTTRLVTTDKSGQLPLPTSNVMLRSMLFSGIIGIRIRLLFLSRIFRKTSSTIFPLLEKLVRGLGI